jgi:lipoate-protein ligase A
VEAARHAPAPTWDEAAQALAAGFAEALELELIEGRLSAEEQEQAEALRREKYAAEEWTLKV